MLRDSVFDSMGLNLSLMKHGVSGTLILNKIAPPLWLCSVWSAGICAVETPQHSAVCLSTFMSVYAHPHWLYYKENFTLLGNYCKQKDSWNSGKSFQCMSYQGIWEECFPPFVALDRDTWAFHLLNVL